MLLVVALKFFKFTKSLATTLINYSNVGDCEYFRAIKANASLQLTITCTMCSCHRCIALCILLLLMGFLLGAGCI